MTWKRVVLALAAIAGAAWIGAGCGGDDNSNNSCNSDTDCKSGQICHPLAKFCVQTCTDSSQCPSSANNCATLTLPNGQTTAKMICQCTSDEQCGGGTGKSAICGNEDKVCEVKCGSDADCNSGRHCDTNSGQCVSPTTTTGACNPNNHVIGANGGPDTCKYGEFCATDGTCNPVQNGGCAQASASGGSSWNGSDPTAPVITNVTASGVANETAPNTCGGGGPASIYTIDYYVQGGLTAATDFPTWRSNVWFDLNPSVPFNNPAFNNDGTINGSATFNEIQVGVCGEQSGTVAIFIQNDAGKTSNTVCVTY